MKYSEVQQSIEEFVKNSWTYTEVHYENVPFNSELFEEFVELFVLFGTSQKRSLASKCYRQPGLLLMNVKVKPGIGTTRALELANSAADMMASTVVTATLPLVAPTVNLKDPTLYKSNSEELGWIKYQVSCPFYYDLEL